MTTARLTFAPTDFCADAYYLAGMHVTDAFAAFELKGKRYAVASALELGNFLKYSVCDEVYSMEKLLAGLKTSPEASRTVRTAALIAAALKKAGARKVEVGSDFPTALYLALNQFIKVSVAAGALFPERMVKAAAALKQITQANRICALGIAHCGAQIGRSSVRKGQLVLDGKPLTSETLRRQVQSIFLTEGLVAVSDLIIAGGKQACDPHCLGSGVLKAGELIIVDLFAPLASTHYWGDMTRTYIKGAPSDAQACLVNAVLAAQQEAIAELAPGVTGDEIHSGVQSFFAANGYETKATAKGYEGFFHGTGHSLGLECHDMGEWGPRLSKGGRAVQVGEVYTVEPGLYYPAIGGCRIEDNGVVTKSGFKLLSKLSYDWVM